MTGLSGRTVLVTGGAGFVGSHIADALVDDNDVRVLDDLSNGFRANVPERATFSEGDVCDERTLASLMDGVDVVFHQAARVSVAGSVERPTQHHETNATGTLRVLEAARRQDARVVLASSAAVYGAPESVPVGEDEPMTPSSPYGVAKLAADRYAQVYYQEYGLPTVPLRYFNIYGPRQRAGGDGGVVATFAERAKQRTPMVIFGDGGQTRDFVHVDDVVQANLAAATTDAVGRAFNVGTGERTTVRELAEQIREQVSATVPIGHAEPRPGDIRHSCADIARARRELGYEPTIGVTAGLESLIGATPTKP